MTVTQEENYRPGDYVNYRNNGICQIDDIRKEDFGFGEKVYYIMHSVHEENTRIRVPVDSKGLKNNMKRLLTVAEINAIIEETEDSRNVWIDDYKQRSAAFEEILAGENRADILWLIKVLSLYRIEAKSQKRKFGVTDEKLLERAEKMILTEFSFILGIKQEEVIPYIIEKAHKKEAEKPDEAKPAKE